MDFPLISDDFDWLAFAADVLIADKVSNDFRRRLHLEWTVRGHRIRTAIADDARLIDLLRAGLPPYSGGSQKLFRGENIDRWKNGQLGLSWSPSKTTAVMFARGLNAVSQGGILLQAEVSPSAIIAGPSDHSRYLNEIEFTVDPGKLDRIAVVQIFGSQK